MEETWVEESAIHAKMGEWKISDYIGAWVYAGWIKHNERR